MRALLTVGAIVGVLFLAAWGIRAINHRISEAYAAWWTSSLVTTYMEQHGGRWPGSWEDLREAYEFRRVNGGVPWSFDLLKQSVEVDFDVDPATLLKEPRKVVRLRSGRDTHWETAEPNELIREYLRNRATTRPATRQGGTP